MCVLEHESLRLSCIFLQLKKDLSLVYTGLTPNRLVNTVYYRIYLSIAHLNFLFEIEQLKDLIYHIEASNTTGQ